MSAEVLIALSIVTRQPMICILIYFVFIVLFLCFAVCYIVKRPWTAL